MMRALKYAALLLCLALGACSATSDPVRIVLKNTAGAHRIKLYYVRVLKGDVPTVLSGGEFTVTCPCEGATVDVEVSGNKTGTVLALGVDAWDKVTTRATVGARQLPGAFDVTLGGITCNDSDQDGFCWNDEKPWKDADDNDHGNVPLVFVK